MFIEHFMIPEKRKCYLRDWRSADVEDWTELWEHLAQVPRAPVPALTSLHLWSFKEFPMTSCLTKALTSFQSYLKWYLFNETHSDHPIGALLHSKPLSCSFLFPMTHSTFWNPFIIYLSCSKISLMDLFLENSRDTRLQLAKRKISHLLQSIWLER